MSLSQLEQQNKFKKHLGEYWSSKGISQIKVQKLIYLFFILSISYSPDLINLVRNSLMRPISPITYSKANLQDVLLRLHEHSQSFCPDITNLNAVLSSIIYQTVDIVLSFLSQMTKSSAPDVFESYCMEIVEYSGKSYILNMVAQNTSSIEEIQSLINAKFREIISQIDFKTDLGSYDKASRLSLNSIDFTVKFIYFLKNCVISRIKIDNWR